MDDLGCRPAHHDLYAGPFTPELMDEFYHLNRCDTPGNSNNDLLSCKRLNLCQAIITS
jgi:hypothetical protein